MKTVQDVSVWSQSSRKRECNQVWSPFSGVTGRIRYVYAAARSRFGVRPALPGIQPSTYHTTGSCFEHGNLDPSAGPAKSGKPTGLVRSRTRGGAPVVVRAWESHAHGEGEQ